MISFINSIKNTNTVIELEHAHRVNGVVDIWKNMKTVYDKPKNKYHNIENDNERGALIMQLIQSYPPQDPFKKTNKGRISMQEFKNNLYQKKINDKKRKRIS